MDRSGDHLSKMLTKKRILIVDDDKEMLGLLTDLLSSHGYSVDVTGTIAAALSKLQTKLPDLMLLDMMLPDGNGIDICSRLFTAYPDMAVIIFTAIDSDIKKILSYESGASLYVTKPFNSEVLLAQIKSVLRTLPKANKKLKKRYVHFDNWMLDTYDRYLLTSENTSVELSSSEYEVLLLLIDKNRTVVSRNDVTTMVYNRPYDGSDRAVDVVMGRLRKKLEKDSANPTLLKTIHGQGYILLAEITYSDTPLYSNCL